jgi:molybdopterin-guanine dinucleotide biosynthesis protein A
MRTLGVLLAGGRGARLGLPMPKALVEWGGETLLARARRELAAVCDAIVVVAPRAMKLAVPDEERVGDRTDTAGPLAALVSGLEARPFDRALALAVDLPRLDRRRLALLLGAYRGEVALVPQIAGRLQPVAAVYAPTALAVLLAALEAGQRALVPAVASLDPRVLDEVLLLEIGIAPGDFADLDTPGDLAALEDAP